MLPIKNDVRILVIKKVIDIVLYVYAIIGIIIICAEKLTISMFFMLEHILSLFDFIFNDFSSTFSLFLFTKQIIPNSTENKIEALHYFLYYMDYILK